MIRGELWTVAGGPNYAGNPRPALIVQEDAFNNLKSITICLLTSNQTEGLGIRVRLEPTTGNGLKEISNGMVDKISTVPRTHLEMRIGFLNRADLDRVDQAMMIFLGLPG